MRNVQAIVMLLFAVACTAKSEPAPPDPSCEPGEFLGCADERTLLRCSADGDEVGESCGVMACNDAAKRCNECVPDTSTCRIDGTVQTCGADGLPSASETCAAGCSSDGASARCSHIVPVWIPDACDDSSSVAQRTLTGTLDTNTACDRVITQVGGPDICVVGARKLEIKELAVTGTRAIAFVGDEVLVSGLLDVNAEGPRNGPGVVRVNGEYDTTYGGGGAGFRQPGAAGGGNEFGANARQGGAFRNPLTEAVFSGGTHAGDDPGFTSPDDPLSGGGGGGALLVACRGTLHVNNYGIISASGGGGRKGVGSFGGAGGGSGGYIVLQGAKVNVTGRLYANGGGGGASCASTTMCLDGQDGFGFGGGSGEGGSGGKSGGRGGRGDLPPMPAPSDVSGLTGGGGGAAGRIQVYTPSGVAPTLTPSEAVTFEPNLNVSVR